MDKSVELVEKIMSIDSDKLITIVTPEFQGQLTLLAYEGEVASHIKRSQLLNVLSQAIEHEGAFTLRVKSNMMHEAEVNNAKESMPVYKIASVQLGNGDYQCISAAEMEESHSYDAEGNYIGKEKGVQYTSFEELS